MVSGNTFLEIKYKNINRIHSRFSDIVRKNNMDAQNNLSEVISNIESEKEMYVPMKANDVIQCLESANKEYPWNTFLRYEEQSRERK